MPEPAAGAVHVPVADVLSALPECVIPFVQLDIERAPVPADKDPIMPDDVKPL